MVEIEIYDGTDVLSRLWDNLISSGMVNRRVDSTRIGLVFSAIATELSVAISLIESYLGQFTLQTCTDKILVENMARLFAVRRLASKSKVVLTFYRLNEYENSVRIPAGFAVQSNEDSTIIFKTIQDVFLWKGVEETSVLAYSIQSGSEYNVEAGVLTEFEDNGFNAYIGVINIEPSYGGYDDEDIESLRSRASGFRYERDGTLQDIQRQLMFEGYSQDKWVLIEPEYEYGTYTICIDTDAETEFEDIQTLLAYRRTAGITQVFKRAYRLYVDMNILVHTTGNQDYTASEKDEIYSLINEEIQRFFVFNCALGQSLNVKNLNAALVDSLTGFQVTSIDIIFDDGISLTGNWLRVGPETRIYPNKITTVIKYEGDYVNDAM